MNVYNDFHWLTSVVNQK